MGAGVIALGTSGFYSWLALAVGVSGLVLLAVGLVRGATAAVTTGSFGLFGSAVVAGVQGAPVEPILVSVVAVVVAWDVGGTAISLGKQLGRETETRRLEAVHAIGSVAVGVATAGVAYGLYRTGPSEQPVAALVFSVIGAVLLLEALR